MTKPSDFEDDQSFERVYTHHSHEEANQELQRIALQELTQRVSRLERLYVIIKNVVRKLVTPK